MSKRLKIYLGILIALIISVAFIEVSKPTPIDWRETYNERQTKPLDVEIFHKEIGVILYDGEINDVYRTPYEFFANQYDWKEYEYKIEGTYMSISPDYLVDPSSIHELLDFAAEGNTIFISSKEMPRYLRDTLGFSIKDGVRYASKATLSFANRTSINTALV